MHRELNPYEKKQWSGLPEGIMRPGGLQLTESLLRRSGLIPPAKILDLGCGAGVAAGFLCARGFRVSGLDRSPLLLEQARSACPAALFKQGEADALPFGDKSFDGVLAECVLSCIGPAEVLNECFRVLRPGGRLLLSDLYLRYRSGRAGDAGFPMTSEAWTAVIEQQGFSILSWTDETPSLTEFVLEFLLNGGTREALFEGAALPDDKAKIGYYALTASKWDE